jgi:nitroimidazol reductase NimA-like FMN-containing flavoprotein (pyridoxamine 5'-phosphate oxidase superfamily)
MLGILNPQQIDHVLQGQVTGRIGCYAAGKVYVVPVTYVYDGEYIYGHTKEGLKIELMRQNPAVCFQVDSIQNMANWQCVIIQGEYQELSGEESQHALRLLSNRITPLLVSETSMPAHSPDIHHPRTSRSGSLVTYRIRILEKTGRYEKR